MGTALGVAILNTAVCFGLERLCVMVRAMQDLRMRDSSSGAASLRNSLGGMGR
jgi:hypothetical protein